MGAVATAAKQLDYPVLHPSKLPSSARLNAFICCVLWGRNTRAERRIATVPPTFCMIQRVQSLSPVVYNHIKHTAPYFRLVSWIKYPMKTLSMSVVINSKGLQLKLTFSPEIVRQTSTNASLYRHEKRRNRKSYALHVVQRGVNPHLAWFPSYNHTHASAWERG